MPYTSTFTTGTPVAARRRHVHGLVREGRHLAPALAGGIGYTGVVIGPDGKLYAGTIAGEIQRFAINADGTLGPGRASPRSRRRTAATD